MVKQWRWDQGRLRYFAFESLKKISECFVELEGCQLRETESILRETLMSNTGLDFRAGPNSLWRNYARVFKCALLAVEINGSLRITDICRKLGAMSASVVDADEYLSLWISRFYFPSPAFQDYQTSSPPIFPLCSILKYLLIHFLEYGDASVGIDEVFSLIIGNQCDGTEPLHHYLNLRRTSCLPGSGKRQVREMLIFASQASWLKWYNGKLYIDMLPGDLQNVGDLKSIVEPIEFVIRERNSNPEQEILRIGKVSDEIIKPISFTTRERPEDVLFTEGRRRRVTHLRTERSPQLRRFFFSKRATTICDMCTCDTRYRYPWTDNLLEIHHILPLSSAIAVTSTGTSLDDVVGLCPNCHRSVHVYYKRWFERNSVDDFLSKEEARAVYQAAKEEIQL